MVKKINGWLKDNKDNFIVLNTNRTQASSRVAAVFKFTSLKMEDSARKFSTSNRNASTNKNKSTDVLSQIKTMQKRHIRKKSILKLEKMPEEIYGMASFVPASKPDESKF